MSSKTTAHLTGDARVWCSNGTSLGGEVPSPFLASARGHRRCAFLPPCIRYVQLVLGTLYLSLILGCVICFNPTITVMMDKASSPVANASTAHPDDLASWSLPLSDRRFAFSNLQKSALLAGTFGACLFQIWPIGYSMQMLGAWRTQLAVGFTVSLSTGLIPLAASLNFYALLLVRMVNGLAITNLFPVVGAICTGWAPQAEKGVFLAVLSGYIQLAVIISMPLTGFLLTQCGWPSVFFVHSAIGMLLTLCWALFYRDFPDQHRWVSDHEVALIKQGKPQNGAIEQNKPPYRQILCTAPIWAILCAVVGNFLIVQFFNTFLPMFLVTALHFSNSQTGLLSALPLILQFFMKWLTGFVTDHLPSVPDIVKVRFCNSIAFCGAALFFLLATLFPAFPRWPVVLSLTLGIGVLGLNSGGFFKSVVLVSVQYSPTVMAGVQFTLCATIFSFSFVIPAMTSGGGHFDEYRRVFWLYAAALVATNLVFLLFGRASPARWTQQKDSGKEGKAESR